VVNFLPIPPLDGGQLLFLICEAVRGRPVPEKYAGPVMIAGLVFVLLLFLAVNLNDVLSYFGN
jgi:regulator of sigma E protease